jgi:hypothetical protein
MQFQPKADAADSEAQDAQAVIDRISVRLELSGKWQAAMTEKWRDMRDQAVAMARANPSQAPKSLQLLREAKRLAMRVVKEHLMCEDLQEMQERLLEFARREATNLMKDVGEEMAVAAKIEAADPVTDNLAEQVQQHRDVSGMLATPFSGAAANPAPEAELDALLEEGDVPEAPPQRVEEDDLNSLRGDFA